MIRNLPLIVVVNVLILFVNLYLLTSTSKLQQDNSDGQSSKRQEEIDNLLAKLEDLNYSPRQGNEDTNLNRTGQDLVKTGSAIITHAKHQKDDSKEEESRNAIHNVPVPDMYHAVFYNRSNPVKRRKHGNWSVLRQGYRIPTLPKTNNINCNALLAGDNHEMSVARDIMDKREFTKVPIYEEKYLEWTKDCDAFKINRGYVTVPLTMEEEQFPIAYSISMFTDVEQMERLLRAVYQPQNLYCVHVDVKSSLLIHNTVRAIANCFDNVFVTSQISKVKWGDVSVLLPHLSCMKDLVKHYRDQWKYFIDLAGQEFPLRTNYEIVQILKIYNGSNDITASHKKMEQDRIQFRWAYRWSRTYQQTIIYNTFRRKEPPPFDLIVLKGEIHGLFSRRFVEYIVESREARKFLQWCWNTSHASEHYWNTLNYNQQLNVPGGYIGNFEEIEEYSLEPVTRAKHWQDINYVPRECQGKLVRGICVYGIGDLPWLATRKEIVANKFYLTFDYMALDCLEERHRNRTVMYVGSVGPDFDAEYYKNLPTVKHSRKNGL